MPTAPNLVPQDFSVEAVNEKWVADITFVWTDEGWLYLAVIEDLFSRYITGWAMESYLTDLLSRKARQIALRRRQPAAGLIHQSGRGVAANMRATSLERGWPWPKSGRA